MAFCVQKNTHYGLKIPQDSPYLVVILLCSSVRVLTCVCMRARVCVCVFKRHPQSESAARRAVPTTGISRHQKQQQHYLQIKWSRSRVQCRRSPQECLSHRTEIAVCESRLVTPQPPFCRSAFKHEFFLRVCQCFSWERKQPWS